MVANINKLKGKIAENGYTMKRLSKEIGMCETTLRKKINDENSEFLVSETEKISKILCLTIEEYINIFLDSLLEFNS